jgi:hypothetical protein
MSQEARSAATTESRRWWWFTDEHGIRRRPTWWFMLRFRLIALRERLPKWNGWRRQDEEIRAWATYDAGAQDVGRALYVAETMIHLAILEGSDPREAVSKHLNDVRDRFAIPYAKGEASSGS